jgi:ribonuclease HI
MSTESSVYLGFADGANRHTQNLASTAWVVYSPEGMLVSSGGVCLGPSMNNVAEYSIIIELLCDAILHGIHSLEVRLDSQLVVCQLNGRYRVCDPTLLRRFLRVRLLE